MAGGAPPRRSVLITGAAGGMGRACARLLGATQNLVLTDVQAQTLLPFAEELREEGYAIGAVHAGDLRDEAVLGAVAAELAGAPFTLVHAAGLSPALAGWRDIIQVNLVATERLLAALEPQLAPGCVAVLVSSAAGYRIEPTPQAQALIADPLAEDFMARLGELVAALDASRPGGAEGFAYTLSKYAVHRICERRAAAWAARGARIVSVSPTLSLTPMGRQEIRTAAGAAFSSRSAPLGRMGTAMDVALAVRFLASDEASFISGCDLRIDGGSVAATVRA